MLRRPRARQIPGRSYLEYELVGRVVHEECRGAGCLSCDFRGWMIDDEIGTPPFPIDPYAGIPQRGSGGN